MDTPATPNPTPRPEPRPGARSHSDAETASEPAPAARDRVTDLFARTLDDLDDTPAADARNDASNDAFGALTELVYAGDSKAERACEAILDVVGARAEVDGTMITPERFDMVLDRATTAGRAFLLDQAQAFERDGFVLREDGSVGFGDGRAGDVWPDGP